ncbi:hypothetical protein [Sporomusa termitida]|uniref:hypothetical protein n=1 Tax=Sporomusa termitida TaxID=2377 RepID=UPI0014791D63|nr:hypothetical protein [Sporomusa termitida]
MTRNCLSQISKILIGVFYRATRRAFENSLPPLAGTTLVGQPLATVEVSLLMDELA